MRTMYVVLFLFALAITGCGNGQSGGSHLFNLSNPANSGSPPGKPAIGIATGGNTEATVSFSAPASDGGKPISTYTVTSSPGGLIAIGPTSPLTVIGLTNGIDYTFTVTATNSAGTSVPSDASNSVTPTATAPGAPTGVSATFGDKQATVSFSAPVNNGGSPITGYTVTSVPGGITATGTTSPITVTGLTNSTGYTFTVTATNALGTGSASVASNSVTPVTPVLMGGAVQGIPLFNPVTVSTFAGNTTWGSINGLGTAASFGQICGITTDGANLYVSEINGTIRKTVIATGEVTTLAGTFNVNGYADGTGAAAQFGRPSSITTDGTNLYMTDEKNLNIRKIVIATGEVTTLAGQDVEFPTPTGTIDGIGTAARFGKPLGITTDGTNLYVADFGYVSIRKIVIATGEVTTLAGAPGTIGHTDGVGSAAIFNAIDGITTDGTNLYVTDTGVVTATIRKIVIASGRVTTIAGNYSGGGFVGADAPVGTDARFTGPSGIVSDGSYLYVVDRAAGNIRRINISNTAVSTLAGAPAGSIGGAAGGYADGIGTAARFSLPRGITTDGKGLYIADADNGMIRKMR